MYPCKACDACLRTVDPSTVVGVDFFEELACHTLSFGRFARLLALLGALAQLSPLRLLGRCLLLSLDPFQRLLPIQLENIEGMTLRHILGSGSTAPVKDKGVLLGHRCCTCTFQPQ